MDWVVVVAVVVVREACPLRVYVILNFFLLNYGLFFSMSVLEVWFW